MEAATLAIKICVMDRIYTGGGGDDARGGDGDDLITGAVGLDERIYGDEGNDTLYGSYWSGYLSFSSDKDTIYGGSGDDKIYGFYDEDRLYGEDGNDTLYGGDGSDRLYGGAGNDLLKVDWFDIDSGEGSLPEKDYLYGDEGDDILLGGAGHDVLYGGAGQDFLDGEIGKDRLYGGDGADIFNLSEPAIFGTFYDRVMDFNPEEGDILRIGITTEFFEWLQGNTIQEAINDFINLTENNGSTELRLNALGSDFNPFQFVKIAVLENITGLDAGELYSSGNLVLVPAI